MNSHNPVAMQMPLERFTAMWPEMQRELDRIASMWEPWYTKAYIFNCVMAGQWQVWGAGHDGSVRLVLFTQIVVYPAARVLQGMLALGNSLDENADAIWAATEQYARQEGCDRIEVLGRPGWERRLSCYGFRKVGVTLSVRVNETRTQ